MGKIIMTLKGKVGSIAKAVKALARKRPKPPEPPQVKKQKQHRLHSIPGRRGTGSGREWKLSAAEVNDFLQSAQTMLVNSSNVAAAQYHWDRKELYVWFKGGTAYAYSDVTMSEALTFATARSKGSWVWDVLRIRGTKYGHRKPYRLIAAVLKSTGRRRGKKARAKKRRK